MKKQSKKKPVALAEYAALMGRVAEYCAYKRECEAAEQTALSDALHGGEEKRPSKAELEKAKRELAQAGKPLDDYNVGRQVVRDRAEAAKPSAPSPDVSSIGPHLSMAQEFGGDPFPKEWERLHNELVAAADLPDRVCAEIERRHNEFVALFLCADNGADGIEDAAHSFNDFLLGLRTSLANANKIGYEGGMSQQEFAKLCGVTVRTVKNWDAKKTKPPTIYHTQRKEYITYDPNLRRDILLARAFAMYYKQEKRDRAAIAKPSQYREN